MKKILPILLFFNIGFCFNAAFSQSNHWMISSEISPLSRSGNQRVLNRPTGLNLEWRNRVGFKLAEQTMMGLSASFRHYNLKEMFSTVSPSPVMTRYTLKNQLLGIGTFLTQYYAISPSFHLQTSGYFRVERGMGSYQNAHLGTGGLQSGIPETHVSGKMVGVLLPPGIMEHSTFRERNLFAGLELGASYSISQRWILQSNINLFQYENFRNAYADSKTQPAEITRPVEQKGSGFTFLTDRPIIHVGVMVLLGKK